MQYVLILPQNLKKKHVNHKKKSKNNEIKRTSSVKKKTLNQYGNYTRELMSDCTYNYVCFNMLQFAMSVL